MPTQIADSKIQEIQMKTMRNLLIAGALATGLAFAQANGAATNANSDQANGDAPQAQPAPAKGSCDCPCCKGKDAQAAAKVKGKGEMKCGKMDSGKMACCKNS
ncbi:MAG TPA: hypothetical protein VMH80_22350 [Bryobacteraceae bacterium]|nr:hypothetical protein [Bryobacteraceae bacterium]